MTLKLTHLHCIVFILYCIPDIQWLLLNDITIDTSLLYNIEVSEDVQGYGLSHMTRDQKVPAQYNVMKQQSSQVRNRDL
jgi:hypothetical protein